MHEETESAGWSRFRQASSAGTDQLTERVLSARAGLTALLSEADQARERRAEAAPASDGAWNHFENIPTFYNWNNRPR